MTKIIAWVVAGFIGLAALLVAVNVISTVTSVATAPGRVVQQTMETNNIITNYEWFHQAHAAYLTRVSQIQRHKAFYAEETNADEKRRLRIELVGMQQSCRELATTYNARSTMTNRSIFRGREAPEELNPQLCE